MINKLLKLWNKLTSKPVVMEDNKWSSPTCLKHNCWGYAPKGQKYCNGCVEDEKSTDITVGDIIGPEPEIEIKDVIMPFFRNK